MPLTYLVPKGREEDGQRTFGRTPRDDRATSRELTGVPYPWNKYAQVVVSDFIFGGMENTTATTMYEHILLDERAALDVTCDDLIAHELAHQWFGDFVTCRDWSRGLAQRGLRHLHGARVAREARSAATSTTTASRTTSRRTSARRTAATGARSSARTTTRRSTSSIATSTRRAASSSTCCARELGDTLFWKGVTTYLKRHAQGVVETRDLLRALEEVTGRSLGRFFEQWVLRAGPPRARRRARAGRRASAPCAVKQTQASTDGGAAPGTFEVTRSFAFDLAFDWPSTTAAPRREVRHVDQASHTFAFPCPRARASSSSIPSMRILGDVTLEGAGRHAAQPARRARPPRAAAGSRRRRSRKMRRPAVDRRRSPRASPTRTSSGACAPSAPRRSASIRAREASRRSRAHAATAHPKVRRAVVAALGRFRTTAAADALKPLALRDESYLVEAEAARALGKTRQPPAFDMLLDVLDRPSWADVIAAGAIDGLAALRDERALPHLFARTRYGIPTRVRRAAILAHPQARRPTARRARPRRAARRRRPVPAHRRRPRARRPRRPQVARRPPPPARSRDRRPRPPAHPRGAARPRRRRQAREPTSSRTSSSRSGASTSS